MAKGHPDLSKTEQPLLLSKQAIYAALTAIDGDAAARGRVLAMETGFRSKIATHLQGLPTAEAKLRIPT